VHKNISQKIDNNGHIILTASADLTKNGALQSEHFDAKFWLENNLVLGESKGRHTTYFVKPQKVSCFDDVDVIEDEQWVLRHYYRGGLVAKLISDSYLYTGLEQTRCYRELDLLGQMLKLKLPVPKPIAARVVHKGIYYRADLIMRKLLAEDLVAILKIRSLDSSVWQEIGKTVANFHNNGIHHADLNAHNLMLGNLNTIWLIDFDRCLKKTISSTWQQSNIKRLHRSLIKEKGLHTDLNFSEKNWRSFEEGYCEQLQ